MLRDRKICVHHELWGSPWTRCVLRLALYVIYRIFNDPIKSSILYTSNIIIDHRGHRPPQFVSIPTDRDIKSNNILDTEEVSSFDRRSKVFPTPRRYPVSSVWKECRCKLSCFKMVDRRDYFVLDKFNTHIFISTNQKCPTVPNHSDPSNRSVAHHPSVVMVAMVVAVVDSLMM